MALQDSKAVADDDVVGEAGGGGSKQLRAAETE
jgi:hypothetical protein